MSNNPVGLKGASGAQIAASSELLVGHSLRGEGRNDRDRDPSPQAGGDYDVVDIAEESSPVVARFGSFKLPLAFLTPTPLTLIGVVLGHRLFSAPFTAASMIGFIALAGTIVCNAIMLVGFIRHGEGHGEPLWDVLLGAGAVLLEIDPVGSR